MFCKAFTCAIMLDWFIIFDLDGRKANRAKHWFGKLPSWSQDLQTWTEAQRKYYEKKVQYCEMSIKIIVEARKSDMNKASSDEFPTAQYEAIVEAPVTTAT
eukprot:4877441-Ditylum_brightwellii.AAC.2